MIRLRLNQVIEPNLLVNSFILGSVFMGDWKDVHEKKYATFVSTTLIQKSSG